MGPSFGTAVLAIILLVCLAPACLLAQQAGVLPHLPGELSADQVLNGEYPYPPSPRVDVAYDHARLQPGRLTEPPPPGVHPRILLSPADLPGLRQRLGETATGRAMMSALRIRTGATLLREGTWENQVYGALAAGDTDAALAVLDTFPKPSHPDGHYQPGLLYGLAMEAFDAMVSEDRTRGRKVAAAIAGYAKMVEPAVDRLSRLPLSDDVWRAKLPDPQQGSWLDTHNLKTVVGEHLLGYAYDFAYNDMTDAERATVRRVIAKVTGGRLWMGARLPHHFRNWNWVMCALSQPTLALAIEGEEGYDPRVYRLGVEIARDYLTYGISPAGASTEAVGYTQFGLVWGAPFIVAASRRGDVLLTHQHHLAMLDWYLHSMEPYGGRWQSHGDGGDRGPAVWTMAMWRYHFPRDPRVQVLWDNMQAEAGGKALEGRYHIIEPLIWCPTADDEAHWSARPATANDLSLGLTLFDAVRGSLNVRSGWNADDAAMQFECRIDSVGASHEHADRGNFTFSALGRAWSIESFRSIESRHHSVVMIDGLGQGYWPGPGRWLGMDDAGWAVIAAIDAKAAYDWFWPKSILADDLSTSPRFGFPRWAEYAAQAARFQQQHGRAGEPDDRPSVKAFWEGYHNIAGGPRLWDEDGWPVRYAFNPVERAYRTVVFVRSPVPYAVIVDDIQKDDRVRLYEWQMMTGTDTDVASLSGEDVVLCDAGAPRDAQGMVRPRKGERQLLVRVLNRAEPPGGEATLPGLPSIRLETFEKRDTNSAAGRSFGRDRRLVVPSRSATPEFRVLLFPHRQGDALPETTWDEQSQSLTVTIGGVTDTVGFVPGADGRTRVSVARRQPDVTAGSAPSDRNDNRGDAARQGEPPRAVGPIE